MRGGRLSALFDDARAEPHEDCARVGETSRRSASNEAPNIAQRVRDLHGRRAVARERNVPETASSRPCASSRSRAFHHVQGANLFPGYLAVESSSQSFLRDL